MVPQWGLKWLSTHSGDATQASPILRARAHHTGLCAVPRGLAGVALGKQVSLEPLSFYLKKKFRLETVKTTPLASLPCSQVLRLEIDCADEEGSSCGFHTQSLLA